MRVNIYAEELPELDDVRAVRLVEKKSEGGIPYFGIRLYLNSPAALPDTPYDDDRSAVTIWGSREKLSALLRLMRDAVEHP